jgi:hypothetical protein
MLIKLGIYSLLLSTLLVVLLLHITFGDLIPIPFYTVCGVDTAHFNWVSTTYSFLTLSVVVIRQFTAGDIKLIFFNSVCCGDSAYYD